MTGSIKWPMAVVAILAAGQLGCRGDSPTDPGSDQPNVEALSPVSMIGIVGALAPHTPAFRVTNGRTGKPQVNVQVVFRLSSGGSVANAIVFTDSAGIASPGEWRFAERAGSSQLSAIVDGWYGLITFYATVKPDVPHHLRALWGEDQAGIAGQSVQPLVVAVEDRFQNPISSVEVKFSVVEGGGTLESEKDVTDEIGGAYAEGWELGSIPGKNVVSASISGVEPLLFRAEGLNPENIRWYKLEAMRDGQRVLKLDELLFANALIGLTSFDKCLCHEQRGYFLRTATYPQGGGFNESGAYLLSGADLYAPRYWSRGSIDEAVLILVAPDPWLGEWDVAWIYREIKESVQ